LHLAAALSPDRYLPFIVLSGYNPTGKEATFKKGEREA